LFRDIFSLAIYKVSGVIVYSTESIIISAYVGTVDVAILGNFRLVVTQIRTTIEQIVSAIRPSIGNLAAVESKGKQESVFKMLNFLCFWIACFGCTCFYVLLNPFIGDIWFDPSYKISQGIVALIVANFFVAVMVYPVESFRTANGLFIQGRYRPAIMAVMNVVLAIIFVQKWGIAGVYIATLVSRLLTQCWFDPYLVYHHVFHKMPWTFFRDYLLQAVITAVSCAVAFWLANIVSIENRFLFFGYQLVVSLIIPNAIMVLLFFRTREFKSILRMGIGMLKKRIH